MIRFPGWGAISVGIGLALAGASPLAAQTAPVTNNSSIAAPAPPPNANVVGPRELQNFSLGGRPTRPAGGATPPQTTTIAPPPTARPVAEPNARVPKSSPPPTQASRRAAPEPATPDRIAPAQVTAKPRFDSPSPPASLDIAPEPAVLTTDLAPPPARAPNWPWWLAALAALAAVGVVGWRRIHPHAVEAIPPLVRASPAPVLAGTINARVSAPSPPSDTINARTTAASAPHQPRSAHPALDGAIVSRGLRPQLAFEFTPLRAEIDDSGAALLSFELVVINNGGAPARELTVETAMVNAGPDQDREIANFFRSPVARGDRIPLVPPMGRTTLRSRVPLAPHQISPIEIEGRKLLVPLVAINALYRWSGGDGQQSASFLVGRGGEDGGKMGPFSLDRGPRAWAGLGARQHSAGLPA